MTTIRTICASLLLALAAALTLAAPARAEPCRSLTFDGTAYTLCEATAGDDLRLWHMAPDGRPLGTFTRLRAMAEAGGKTLAFAMNAGMYHPDRQPVGLYIEDGIEQAPIVTRAGPGNFAMLPNGVFCIRPNGTFAVIESRAFSATQPACRFATQSGPMLVIDGTLHPRFIPGSDSRYLRNGVGVSRDGSRAVFALSDRPVNFHDFARLFRDGLGLPQALYLDGRISRLYAPGIGRSDAGLPMGPMVGLLVSPES